MSELETAKDLLKISVWPALICALKSALMPASFGTILKSVRYIAIDLLVLLLILASHILYLHFVLASTDFGPCYS